MRTAITCLSVSIALLSATIAMPAAGQIHPASDIAECSHGIEVAKRHHADPTLRGTGPDPVAHPLRTQCYRQALAQLRAQDGDLMTQTLRARAQDEESKQAYYRALHEASDTSAYDTWHRQIELDVALSHLPR